MRIKMLVMDVDGTLTDGKLYIGNQGEAMKAFSIKDGYAIAELLPQYGIEPVIITGRESTIVTRRCEELGIKAVFQNCKDKKEKLIEIAKDKELALINNKVIGVAYIGDDIQDVPCMQISEIVGCPYDAVQSVKDMADYVSKYNGGYGAVRDFVEWLLREVN